MSAENELYRFETRNWLVTARRLDDEPGSILELDDETADSLYRGDLDCFAVLVQVFRKMPGGRRIELGADLLGGCIYTSADAFVREHREHKSSDYFTDMVRTAIAEARANLKTLCE